MMKKVWVSMLIILLIFSLISCGNGKNGTSKEIQNIKDKKQLEKKFELEPYLWVSRKPILKNTELSNTEGSWQYESERYKKLKAEGKDELKDGHKLGERLILFIKIIHVNGTNIMEHRPWGSPSLANVNNLQNNSYLVFDIHMLREKSSDQQFYTNDKKKLESDINVFIASYEGKSEYSLRLKKYYMENYVLPAEKDFGKVNLTEEELYYIKADLSYPSDDMAFKDLPLSIKSSTFCTRTPGPDFYSLSDLEILEVDVNGNIRTRYGNEEFIISPGESWQSKMKEQELSRDLFVYDWPYKENGKWKKSDIHRIIIRGRKRKEKGGWTSSEVSFLYTNDDNLLKISKENKRYSISEFKKMFNLIKEKHPDFTLNFKPEEWERISIGYYPPMIFDRILQKKENPIFISQIKVINYGWRIYYY